MSLDLKDFRANVPVDTWAMIKGHAEAFNKEEGEIVRQILTEWSGKLTMLTVWHARHLLPRDCRGASGNDFSI